MLLTLSPTLTGQKSAPRTGKKGDRNEVLPFLLSSVLWFGKVGKSGREYWGVGRSSLIDRDDSNIQE